MAVPAIDFELARLRRGAERLRRCDHAQLAELAAACRRSVADHVDAWVAASIVAKGWAAFPAAAAEEWASGPVPVARYLHQLERLHRTLQNGPLPELPALGGDRYRVPPSPGLADGLLLRGLRVTLHGMPGAKVQTPARRGGVALVLGAGNVTATPVLDILDQVFRHGRAVVLKPSPLHDAVLPHLVAALLPLRAADLLAVVPGDASVGRDLGRAGFDAVHLTGSSATWGALRADPALAGTELSAEVGCCTPALVVPGRWRGRDLQVTAEQLARYVASNGGGTCLAPRVLLTAADWPQRQEFVARLDTALAALPVRPPFHPSAREHWQTAAGRSAPALALPPVRRHRLDPRRDLPLLRTEHFAPVLLDWPLAADGVDSFLDRASGFVRDHVFGALSCYLFAPPSLRRTHAATIAATVARLPHGVVAINTWTGLGYGFGSTPWGAPPGAPDDAGRGQVRGSTGLSGVRQTVIEAPLRPWPLPPWLAPDRRATATLCALARFYLAPSPLRFLRTVMAAVLPRR